jgi:MtN3 and saliva related transmembrane protein
VKFAIANHANSRKQRPAAIPIRLACKRDYPWHPFFKASLMNDNHIQIIGVIAGGFTALSLLPQFLKILNAKKAEDISMLYLFTLFLGISLWIWYGVLRNDLPIVLTNIVSLILNLPIMILGLKYKKESPRKA